VICRSCQSDKPLSDFFKNKTYSCGYDTKCKTCVKAYYTELNKKPEIRAKRNKQKKAWVDQNKEKSLEIKAKYRAANKEAMNEYSRKWAKENRDLKNANWQRYRARKLQATLKDDPAINYIYYAAEVIKKVFGGRPDVDHIIPLHHDLVCGLHVPQNLQLMNPSANYSKGNTWRP
jgi:hypothetical protein